MFSILFASLVLASHVQADAECSSVSQTVQLAGQNDPRIADARAGVQLAEADFSAALALRRPQFSTFARTSSGDTGLTSNQIENQVGLQVSQRLIDFGDARIAREQARNEVISSELSVQVQQISSAAYAARAHLDYVLTQQNLAVVEEQISYFADLERRLSRLLDEGAATRDSLSAVRSRLAAARAEATELELDAIDATISVAMVTGQNDQLCTQVSEGELLDISLADGPPSSATLETPRIRSIQRGLAAAEAEVRRARRERLPVIDVVAIGSYAYDDFRDDWEFRDRVGVDISVPLYQGGASRARVTRARADVARRESQLALAQRRVTQELQASSSRIRALQQLFETSQGAERTKREELQSLEIAFEGGQRTLFELLETRLGLADAQRSLNRVRHQLYSEYLALGELTGQINIELESADGPSRKKIWGWEPDPDD